MPLFVFRHFSSPGSLILTTSIPLVATQLQVFFCKQHLFYFFIRCAFAPRCNTSRVNERVCLPLFKCTFANVLCLDRLLHFMMNNHRRDPIRIKSLVHHLLPPTLYWHFKELLVCSLRQNIDWLCET